MLQLGTHQMTIRLSNAVSSHGMSNLSRASKDYFGSLANKSVQSRKGNCPLVKVQVPGCMLPNPFWAVLGGPGGAMPIIAIFWAGNIAPGALVCHAGMEVLDLQMCHFKMFSYVFSIKEVVCFMIYLHLSSR